MKIQFKIITYMLCVLFGLLLVSNPATAQTRTGVQTRNPQGALHVDGKMDNPKGVGVPNNTVASNDIIITDEGKVGVGTLTPKAAMDLRSANNDNAFGLGTTTLAASMAEAGAFRYEEVNKRLEFSDGVRWSSSYIAPNKAAVVAQIVDNKSIPGNAFTTLNNWREDKDITSSFNASTGVFMAPRTGYYSFFLTYDFMMAWINYETYTEARLMKGSTVLGSAKKTFNRTSRGTQAGALFHITVKLQQGETAHMQLYHNLGGWENRWGTRYYFPRDLRTHINQQDSNSGFNHISIVEH